MKEGVVGTVGEGDLLYNSPNATALSTSFVEKGIKKGVSPNVNVVTKVAPQATLVLLEGWEQV